MFTDKDGNWAFLIPVAEVVIEGIVFIITAEVTATEVAAITTIIVITKTNLIVPASSINIIRARATINNIIASSR